MLSRGWHASKSLRSNARNLTDMVRVVEVGPRDGLQSLKKILPTATKLELINQLADTGLRSIEVTSCVSAKWIPQMADSAEILKGIKPRANVDYSVLVPNVKGLCRALELVAKEVIVVASVTEGFSRANLNCSVPEALERIREMGVLCRERKVRMRGALSCCLGCPYDGEVDPKRAAELATCLLELGCYEVSLADTIGVGVPRSVARLLEALRAQTGGDIWRFAFHCHDTYGQALANVYECLNQGIRVFDSSVAGLGGCPYAPGATGNVATEDLIYLLHGQGMQTGVDLEKLVRVGDYISKQIPTANCSRVGNAMLPKCCP